MFIFGSAKIHKNSVRLKKVTDATKISQFLKVTIFLKLWKFQATWHHLQIGWLHKKKELRFKNLGSDLYLDTNLA